jgi:hypothetical protein
MYRIGEQRIVKSSKASRARQIAGRRAILLISFLCFAAFVAAVVALPNQGGPSKESKPDRKAFVGTWKASFHGEVFAVLVLEEHRGELEGTMNNFDIGVDRDGNLTDDTHKNTGEAPLFNVQLRSGALYFLVPEKDAYSQPTEWKFVPKTAEEGELIVQRDDALNAPPGLVIKPIRMVRERPKP